MSNDPETISISREDAQRLVNEILKKQPALKEFGIIFRTPSTQYKIQEPKYVRPGAWLVLEQSVIRAGFSARVLRAMPDIVAAIFGTASCVALGVASAAEVAVAPATGGSSMALVAFTWAGAAASAATTGVSIGRVYNEVFGNPENNRLMDSTAWVNNTLLILDGIAIGSLSAARAPLLYNLVKNRKTPGLMLKELESLNRHKRRQLTKEIGYMMYKGNLGKTWTKAGIELLLKKEVLEIASSVCGVLGSLYSGALGSGYKFVIRAAFATTA